jgi:hypothetical protein
MRLVAGFKNKIILMHRVQNIKFGSFKWKYERIGLQIYGYKVQYYGLIYSASKTPWI